MSVFAVEETCAQVAWSSLGPGRHELAVGGERVRVEAPAGERPGAAVLEGLRPGTRHVLRVDGRPVSWFRTLQAPPGRLLCRVGVVSDLHVGDRRFGAFFPLADTPRRGIEPFALRCARAALQEALAWGAEVIVVKGDLTKDGARHDVDTVGKLLGSMPVPVLVIPGNHDVKTTAINPGPALRRHGVELMERPSAVDLPGVRLVLGQTARRRVHQGRLDPVQADELAGLAGDAPGPAIVVLHHHLQRTSAAVGWPPGVPANEGRVLLDAIAAANPATLVTTGHTHRYRRRRHGPIEIVTTGSPKDYPGAWAGFAVHEGGVRQVVRRVAAPDSIAWTERTGRALAGGWALASPGLRSHRCFTHVWPDRPGR